MEFSHNEEFAYEKGYRVVGDKVISHLGNVLKPSLTTNGYPFIGVWKDGKHLNISIHRLVAYQKYGEEIYTPGLEVRHLNNNKLDFSLKNIVLGTSSDNKMDRPEKERKLLSSVGGKAASGIVREILRKLSDKQVLEIRRRLRAGETQTSLAEIFGVHQVTIFDIKHRKTYAHLEGDMPNFLQDRKRSEEARVKVCREISRKLTDEQVLEIRERLIKGETGVSLAKEFKVSNHAISNVKHRKTYTHI